MSTRPWLLLASFSVVVLLLLWPKKLEHRSERDQVRRTGRVDLSRNSELTGRLPLVSTRPGSGLELNAEQIVAGKLSQFARSRRGFALSLAERHKVQMPPEVEQFFTAVESGNWDDISAAFKKINGGDTSASQAERPPGVAPLWPAIIDAYGAAEQVHEWPAQKLLEYGNAILDTLRPGMIYVGGTDSGRWIPELLNDTSDGERHTIITQNGLAAADYLEYLHVQYDDRLNNLSEDDSKRAFEEYIGDVQKRLAHDRQFPDEPKQILPGENVQMVDGKVQVGGQQAVMSINQRLLEALIQKNPDLSFALQESFPLSGTYPDALPLGPIMELHARDDQNTFTADRAAESLEYWRRTADQILADPEAISADSARKSYSHDTVATGNLLAAHDFTGEAEEAYRLATTIWPGNPEASNGLAEVLAQRGRPEDAERLLKEFNQKFPEERANLERLRASARAVRSAGP